MKRQLMGPFVPITHNCHGGFKGRGLQASGQPYLQLFMKTISRSVAKINSSLFFSPVVSGKK